MRQETLHTGRSGRLHGRLWTGEQDPVGVVVVLHGMGDHGGRYESLAKRLLLENWAVFAFDLTGHGQSPGGRGRIHSYDGLLADIAAARKTVHQRLTVPQVLLGHSMGGNLAINYVLRQGRFDDDLESVMALCLCAPMLLPPTPPPRPQILAAWLTGHLLPWLRINASADVDALTSDPERAKAMSNDPLMHSKVTIYLATQLLSQGRWALDHARDLQTPMLVMYGDQDKLIDRSACDHLQMRSGGDTKLIRWPEGRHDLFHDRDADQVMDAICAWLGTLVE